MSSGLVSVGCNYFGDWTDEPTYTIEEKDFQFHLCEKKTNDRKQIVGSFNRLDLAEILMEGLCEDRRITKGGQYEREISSSSEGVIV